MSTSSKPQLGREYPTKDEGLYIEEMLTDVRNQLAKLYTPGNTLRQAHPKEHGLLKAEFIVAPDLPTHLQVGVFAKAQTYPAWVRLSNASTKVQDDRKKDVRGFAIKLVGIPGEKLLPGPTNQETQDFLMVSNETFLVHNLKEFAALIKAVTTGKMIGYLLNPFHWGTLARTAKEMIKVSNVLQIPYWSTVPYQFGALDQAVKYHVKPTSTTVDPMPSNPSPNFLRERLVKMLEQGDVEYDFMVQFQENATTMPIEDPTVKWTSPFVKVATIRIPKQQFDETKQLQYGQDLSFSPWHSLPAHRPLGCFNRARRTIYPAMAAYRLQRNSITPPKVVPPNINENTSQPTKNTTMNNKEIIQKMLAAYQQKDLPGVLNYMADDVVWFTQGDPTAIPYAGTYTGKKEVTGYFELEAKLIKAQSFTPTGLIGADDGAQQVFMAHETVLVNATGKTYETDFSLTFTLNNGLVTHVLSMMDTLAVAKAFE